MAHAIAEEHGTHHMGMPLPHGKLAMWIFLITEIMFFTALIGTYIILRNGQPTRYEPWPTPDDVHLVEWIGALNTFVLICSSLTVVLAHWSLHLGDVRKAVLYIAVTLALGLVFIGIKAIEYKSKFEHRILPGLVHEKIDEYADGKPRIGPHGVRFLNEVDSRLDHIVNDANADPAAVARCKDLLTKMRTAPHLSPKQVNETIAGTEHLEPVDQVPGRKVLERDPKTHKITKMEGGEQPIKGILEDHPNLHLPHSIPWGNMWASCYFAMTGFHAIHVLGGLVVFAVMLIKAARGRFGVQHMNFVEYTGLYWHFVDIVWIFLFPLLYLV